MTLPSRNCPRYGSGLGGGAYRNADTIVTQTAAAKSFFERQRLVAPVQVIASAVDTPTVRRDAARASDNRRIIAVGRLAYEKGFDRLINAFAKVSGQHPEWSLRILGDGDQRASLETQVNELKLGERVSMPGWMRPVWGELAEATVFVLPSRYEGFPSALMEAMAVGVPSIAMAEQVGSQAIILNGKNGWLAGPSEDDLATCIASLIQDETTRETVAKNGPAVLDQFGWEAMVDAYEDVLETVLKRS